MFNLLMRIKDHYIFYQVMDLLELAVVGGLLAWLFYLLSMVFS